MTCCVTGHRPQGFPFPRDPVCETYEQYRKELNDRLEQLIQNGYTHFITGMAEGADIDFAQCILLKKQSHPNLTLEAALPYPYCPPKHKSLTALEREAILTLCDEIVEVSPYYHNGCMQKRNMYMVDKSDLVLAIWNGTEKGGTWNTIRYARKREKMIQYILL